MATTKDGAKDQTPKKRQLKKLAPTIRERATKTSQAQPKKRVLRKTAIQAVRPLKAASRVGKKEYYLPLPDNKVGKFLNKKRRVTPSYFVSAWNELRQVNWPGMGETMRLTFAVIIFAVMFGAIIAVTDYGLSKVFKELLLK